MENLSPIMKFLKNLLIPKKASYKVAKKDDDITVKVGKNSWTIEMDSSDKSGKSSHVFFLNSLNVGFGVRLYSRLYCFKICRKNKKSNFLTISIFLLEILYLKKQGEINFQKKIT